MYLKASLCPSNVEHLALWTFQSVDDMSGFAVNEIFDLILRFRSCVNKILLLYNISAMVAMVTFKGALGFVVKPSFLRVTRKITMD